MGNNEKSATPERDKYLAWFEAEKKKGLRSIHISTTDAAQGMPSEEFYAELNRMIEAPEVPITDIL